MNRRFIACGVPALLALAWVCSTRAAEFDATVAPILKEHCLKCHSGDKPKGDLSLEGINADFAKHGESWKSVFEKLSDGSMPPKGKPQPSPEQRRAMCDWLLSGLTAQAKVEIAVNGRARIKRLNRVEYINTMRDLLAAEIDPEELPEDGIAGGFDNVDAALDVSSSLLGSYLETIDAALDHALSPGKRPEKTTRHIDFVSLGKQMTKTNRPMPRFGTSSIVKDHEVVFVSAAMLEKPVLDAMSGTAGLYRFRLHGNTVNTGKPLTLLIYTGNYGRGVQGLLTRPVMQVDVPPTTTTVEFTIPLLAKETISLSAYGMPNIYTTVNENDKLPGLAVQWIEVEGPLIDAWPPKPTTRLLGDLDLDKATAADAEKVLRNFAPRAFRRPVQDAELKPYLDLITARLDKGYTVAAALRVGLTGILCSPDFLYLSATPGKLNGYDLASRLSYFLWSTMPDDELIDLAARGELSKPDVLRQQTERLLGDARVHEFTKNFVGQWLSLRNLKMTIPDKKVYPDFDEWLLHSMPQETHAFFEEILRHDRPVTEFVNADWSMLNERLAKLYGIDGVDGSAIRKVALPAGSHRGGVLTQAAVLKVTANGTNTSPVVRGAWVLDHLLGTPPPPPPKDVPAIEPDIRGAKTMREQLEKHRSIERCAGCHAKIDPLGNALENFDVIGGWRDYYRIVPGNGRPRVMVTMYQGRERPVGKGPEVDAKDALPDGRKFSSVDDLKQILLADPDQIARSLAQKLLVYGTGHRLEVTDHASVNDLVANVKSHHYGFRTLIHELVQSPAFRTK